MVPLKRFIHYVMLGMTLCSMVMFAGCNVTPTPPQGFVGRAYERLSDSGIGPTISGVEITFVKEDSSVTKSVTTEDNGSYRISLSTGRYWVTATHPDYEDYSTVPGFFVVTGDGYQTGNIFLREPRVTTVLLVRHADRANDFLSPEGHVRAEKLAHVARKAGVTAIYVTEYVRTQQTAQPLADFLKLEPIVYTDVVGLFDQVQLDHNGDVVLVVGHSHTVSTIASQFGADIPELFLPDFDNLFVVTRRAGDTNVEVNVVNLQYGEPSSPDSAGASSCQMTTVLLVRHSEGGAAGEQRAETLAHVARKAHQAGATTIYATGYAPTQEIVQPLADTLNLEVNYYDPNDIQGFVNQMLLNHAGEVVVTAGRNDTISEIISELGGSPTPPIFANEYDNLFVITVYEPGQAKVVSLQYGDPSP